MPVPTQSTNPVAGIFQNLLQIKGTSTEVAAVQNAMSKAVPIANAVYQVLNLLPEGELKSWLTANPVAFWTKIFALIKGRKYTSGAYVLGERMNDQIYCNGNIDRRQVSDEMVTMAYTIFNQLFGVRIDTSEDLDALDYGVLAYKNRPVSQGLSDDAIERAVYLKQHYYPIATYNKACWDLRYFEVFPLVDRIPDHEIGKWYSGPLLGGATAVDGVIPINASDIIRQFIGSDFDPNTGNIIKPDGTVITPGGGATNTDGNLLSKIISFVKTNPIPAVGIVAVLGMAYYESEK
jgi:hypothetical protein